MNVGLAVRTPLPHSYARNANEWATRQPHFCDAHTSIEAGRVFLAFRFPIVV
jgi:hypothetical protein